MLRVVQNVPAALAAAERGSVRETGRIVSEGTSQALLESDLVRRAYLGMYRSGLRAVTWRPGRNAWIQDLTMPSAS